MSKSQRIKGAGGERELCSMLSDEFGQSYTRRLGQARDSGCDIDVGPFKIECKRRARIAVYEWMRQAEGSRKPTVAGSPFTAVIPVVAMRADGKGWLMVMTFDDWAKLARNEL